MQTIEELEEQRQAITAAAKEAAMKAAQLQETLQGSLSTEQGSVKDLQVFPDSWIRAKAVLPVSLLIFGRPSSRALIS